MARLDDRLEPLLEEARRSGGFRALKPVRPDGAARVWRGGRRLIDFSSNNYLGLARHPALIERANQWTEKWGAGSGASRLVTGAFEIHQAVEDKLARMKGAEAVLIFNSGFQANSSILPVLLDRKLLGGEALAFSDRLVHASIHHGLQGAGVRQIRYRHNDLDHLETLLKKNGGKPGTLFILTESVFSMDGDQADLEALAALAERYGAFLYVDEAHAIGVTGQHGMGLAAAAEGVDLVMGAFGKALGCFGAYAACSKPMKDYLINRCPGFIYSTSLPPGVLGAMDAALDLVPGMDAERGRLRANAARLRAALAASGIDSAGSTTQIVPAVFGGQEATLEAARLLEDEGLLGVAIRPPTVPKGGGRIRFAVTAVHTDEHMDLLCGAIPRIAGLRP
ncbi:MAG TPA: aminotransferase class I/II-fold pyridoxal phosphate-dependent enzyme [Rhodospirillales bacterium]|nr:aminotransferase class I/II-fold pyridoxal phosphate-dependent enzyme [Rhodospirillales bacterium]